MRDASGRLTWRELTVEPDFVGCGEEALAPQVKAEWLLVLIRACRASHVLGLSSVERPLEWVSWARL